MTEEGHEHDDETTLAWFRMTGGRLADALAPTLNLEDRLLRVTSPTGGQRPTDPSAAAGPVAVAHTSTREVQFDAARVRVGIITALPVEFAAVRHIIGTGSDLAVKQDPHRYFSAAIASKTPGRPHQVVLTQSRDDRRDAPPTAAIADLLRSFPSMRVVIMCGIASGVSAPGDPDRHVRLGDIVVATDGIIDYGHMRRVDGATEVRGVATGMSAALRRADDALQAREQAWEALWLGWLDQAALKAPYHLKPPTSRGSLLRNAQAPGQIEPAMNTVRPGHGGAATDSGKGLGYPRVWRGAIGSGDILLRDARFRDQFAARHRILAVEMEGAGLAATLAAHGRQWFQVRGISDYCDNAKNDEWHEYAALTAAAYVRSLLAECPPLEGAPGDPIGDGVADADEVPAGSRLGRLEPIVEALLGLSMFQDGRHRRAVVGLLPGPLRAAVSDSAVSRLHVVNLVSTCQRTPGGRNALLDALRLAFGETSAEYQDLDTVIRGNWPDR